MPFDSAKVIPEAYRVSRAPRPDPDWLTAARRALAAARRGESGLGERERRQRAAVAGLSRILEAQRAGRFVAAG